MNGEPNTKIRDFFSQLGQFWKMSLICLALVNLFVNLGFKYLIVRLSLKSGPLKKNPLNIMILTDEFQRLIGVISLTSNRYIKCNLVYIYKLLKQILPLYSLDVDASLGYQAC